MNKFDDFSNFDDFPYRNDLLPKDINESMKFFSELKEKFLNELESSTKVQNYLSQFYRNGSDGFIKDYMNGY